MEMFRKIKPLVGHTVTSDRGEDGTGGWHGGGKGLSRTRKTSLTAPLDS